MQVRDASMQPDELSVVMTEPSSRRQSSLSRQFVTVMALRKVAGETDSEVTDSVQTKVDSVRRQLPSASVRVHSGSAASMHLPRPERFFRGPQVSVDDDVQVMVVRYSRQGRTPVGSVFTQTLELTVHLLPQALILPVTGASRHTLQTFQSTMSIRQTELTAQMQSKEHTLTTTNRSGICI